MLEIVILIVLAGKIGKIVEKKGRKKTRYQLLLIGLWIGGEVLGGVLGIVVAPTASIYEGGRTLLAFFALGGGILGSVIAFQIARRAQPLDTNDEFYRDIDYVERLRAREHFRDRDAVPPSPTDAYTDHPEKSQRPLDDRIQE
jgi:hypothetical protein